MTFEPEMHSEPILTCKAKYRWTREAFVAAMRQHRKTNFRPVSFWMMKIFGVFLLSLVGLAFLLWLMFPYEAGPPWRGLIVAVFGAYFLLFEKINEWLSRRRFEKRPDANQDVDWYFSKEQVKSETALSKSTFEWKHFLKVVETNDSFLFYPFEGFLYRVPFTAFESPDCINHVRRFIIENDVNLIQSRGKRLDRLGNDRSFSTRALRRCT